LGCRYTIGCSPWLRSKLLYILAGLTYDKQIREHGYQGALIEEGGEQGAVHR
jgi:hypothetical protein